MFIDIDSSAVVVHTNRLEKISKYALPYAIRNTLNSAAFDVKTTTMPRTAAREFTQRVPNFFKANSRVDLARGNDIRLMKATVGFIPNNSNGADRAVSELEQQEYGGTIGGRSFIPMTTARGGNDGKPVRPSNRISKVKKIINSNTITGKTPAQKFRHAVSIAGVGGYVIGNNEKKTLFKVVSLNDDGFKVRPLFSYKENRKVKVTGTGFMRDASMESGKKLDDFYIREANKQIDRIR